MRVRQGLVTLLVVAGLELTPVSLRADILTFSSGRHLLFSSMFTSNPITLTEGLFSYRAAVGQLQQNTSPGIEGYTGAPAGGILDVFRSDVPGALFTFDSVQISQFGFKHSVEVDVTGYRNGVQQGVDIFFTSSTVNQVTTVTASGLSGVLIDDLQIYLNSDIAPSPGGGSSVVAGNLTLAPAAVPEPASFVLVIAGLVGVSIAVLRKKGTQHFFA
jgi:hypothetical protein